MTAFLLCVRKQVTNRVDTKTASPVVAEEAVDLLFVSVLAVCLLFVPASAVCLLFVPASAVCLLFIPVLAAGLLFIPVFIHDVVAGNALVEFFGLLGVDLLDEFGRYAAP